MTIRATLECDVLRNTATYEAPTWVPMTNIRNVGVPDAMDTKEVTRRGSKGTKQFITTLRERGLEFEMDAEDGQADYDALATKYAARTELDIVVLRGPNTEGSKGIRLRMRISEFGETQDEAGNPITAVKCVVGPEETPVLAYTVPGA